MRSRAILAQVIRGWKPRRRGIPRPVVGSMIKGLHTIEHGGRRVSA